MTISMELQDKNLPEVKGNTTAVLSSTNSTEKEKKKKNWKKILLIIGIFIVVSALGFLGYKGYIISKDLGFKLDSNSLLNKKTELKKDSSGNFTNALLVGIDTREEGELFNTDTIILVSYNYTTKESVMLSIPRDFNVEIGKDTRWFERINAVYASAEKEKEGTGMDTLKETVEKVTGMEIQYYAMIDFKAFIEIVDLVEGIDVNVENNFTDYSYPSGKSYQTVSFKAGPQTMDGDTALKFARSRHSQQNNEGSDYARARRQQKVIVALKEKILSNETLTNPRKVVDILSSLSQNIQISEFTINDVEAGIELAKNVEESEGKTFSFVLDPTSGNYSLVETKLKENGAFTLGPKEGFGVYTNIQTYLKNAFINPGIYSEKPNIYVYDVGLGNKGTLETVKALKSEFPYINIVFYGTLYKDKEGVTVYSNTESFPKSIKTLSTSLKTELNSKPKYITSNIGNGGVTILLGKEIQLEVTE
ncbi:MAG: LCP family protein [Candidatus Dojkabacteria bacterium]